MAPEILNLTAQIVSSHAFPGQTFPRVRPAH